ncbi:MAG TPA: IS110 family transposase [Candidatus Portnoybacteria bacterium]|nr:IS110 family transposase [Candidatus Portnoybacteria bacterium]
MATNFYLGIDVSKGYADFVILNQKKEVIEENFQLDDTFEGHNQLFKILSDFYVSHPVAKLFVAVESTGGYENNWFNTLHKLQSTMALSVARLNPFGVNHSSKASMNRIITDKQSAKYIAEYLISYPEIVNYQSEDYFATARRQWSSIKIFTKQKTQLLNQLNSLLYIANPEILAFCRDGVRLWTLLLLQKYPTALKLSRARVSSLSKIPYLSKARAEEIIGNAKESVASASDEIIEETITTLVGQIISLRKIIARQIKLLETNVNLPEEVKLLKSFNGIGTYSAVGLMIEIISVERFASSKKLASFFGLHPVFKVSGDGKSGFRMSKKGRKEPRNILFNVTRYSIAHNQFIKDIYINHLKKGISKLSAMGAIMHKILRIIYGMLKNNSTFNAQIDIDNRNKSKAVENQSSKIGIERRFQKHDINAPISRRQNKMRKKNDLTPKTS